MGDVSTIKWATLNLATAPLGNRWPRRIADLRTSYSALVKPPPTSRLFSGAWWRRFLPTRTGINARERLRVITGALLGIFFTGFVGTLLSTVWHPSWPWLVAPMGAAAVLVFAVPASPMAQPWPVIGGNTLSALVGIAAAQLAHGLGSPELAAAVAVAAAIGLMLALRCLHPPGGATALLMVLSGVTDVSFAIYPVLTNSVLLVLAGVVFNNITARPYPHVPAPAPKDPQLDADLDTILNRYNQVLDINRDDLRTLVTQTQMRSYDRKLAEVRCADVMSRDLVTVQFGTSLQEAWALLRDRRIKALPVVDRSFRIAGIVTLADFLRAAELDVHDGFDEKLKKLIRRARGVYATKPEVVGQIMTRNVRVSRMDRHLVDLVPLFGSTGHHHIPIIGDGERLVGIITQSDLVAALGRAADPAK